jgi:hypothetical protein
MERHDPRLVALSIKLDHKLPMFSALRQPENDASILGAFGRATKPAAAGDLRRDHSVVGCRYVDMLVGDLPGDPFGEHKETTVREHAAYPRGQYRDREITLRYR